MIRVALSIGTIPTDWDSSEDTMRALIRGAIPGEEMKEKDYNQEVILTFKTVSPLFEMERDDIKPFTTRLWDSEDERFKTLEARRYKILGRGKIFIKFVNPANGESFIRKYLGYSKVYGKWVNIWLGDLKKS